MTEPEAPDPNWPRYSDQPFPRYRFVPGLNPHPRSHPEGHSYGAPDEWPPPWNPAEWRTLEPYLLGVDLFNYAYWWECHETLEGLWHRAGRTTTEAQFLQGIIQVSAAHLNRHLRKIAAARRQVKEGLARMKEATLMGLDSAEWGGRVRTSFEGDNGKPVLIRLE